MGHGLFGRWAKGITVLACVTGPALAQSPPDAPQAPASPTSSTPDTPVPPGDANAKPSPQELQYVQPTWRIEFEPEVWFAAAGGKLRFPGGTGTERVETFNLDNPRLSPMGALHVREGDWRLAVSGLAFSTSDRGSVQDDFGSIGGQDFAPGTPTRATLDFTTFQLQAGYRLPVSGVLAGDIIPDFYATWEVTGGVRFFDVDVDATFPSGTAGSHEFFAAPVVGFRMALEMTHGFSVELEGDVGGFSDGGHRTVFTNDVNVGFLWRPQPNVGVRFGYRQVAFSLVSGEDSDEFQWNGALAGLHAGLVLRF